MCRSYLSDIKKEGKIKGRFPFIVWCMFNTVSKNHIETHIIERCITNPPHWQRLRWPSSYGNPVTKNKQVVGAFVVPAHSSINAIYLQYCILGTKYVYSSTGPKATNETPG